MRIKVTVLSLCLLAVFLSVGCSGSELALPKGEIVEAKYRFFNGEGAQERRIDVTQDIVRRLNKIRFCGTGATTISDFIEFEYKNGIIKSFGVANFGNDIEPSFALAYGFSGNRKSDLKRPCDAGYDQELTEILQMMMLESI